MRALALLTLLVLGCSEERQPTGPREAPEPREQLVPAPATDWIDVDADSFEEMQRRSRAAGMQFPYVVDETSGVARAFGATRTPEVFLFDRGGRLVYHGAVDDNAHEPDAVQQHYLRDALAAVVAGRAPAQPETRSMGCTIKLRPAR